MDNARPKIQKDEQGEENLLCSLSKDRKSSGDDHRKLTESKANKLMKRENIQPASIINIKRIEMSESFVKNSLHQSIRRIKTKIPRHVVTLDEKYLRCCLEYIHTGAAAQCNKPANLSFEGPGTLSEGLNPVEINNENIHDLGHYVFECPLVAESTSVVIGPTESWIVGSIMSSQSMISILKSPLLQKAGKMDAVVGKTSFKDLRESISTDFVSSPGRFSKYSSQKLEKGPCIPRHHRNQSDNLHKKPPSLSTSKSTCSDQSFSSDLVTISQGMLHCSWKDGLPHFVFFVDDQKEVYLANLLKDESSGEMDCTYLFHSGQCGQKELLFHDGESHLIGKMKVSTSFIICSQNSKVRETEFVLFGHDGIFIEDMQIPSHNHRRNTGHLKKVVKVFRNRRQRTLSRFGGSSSVLENMLSEPTQDTFDHLEPPGGANLLEEHLPPNLELAAIVVKDHMLDRHQPEFGGWGLRFLKKMVAEETMDTLGLSGPSGGRCSCATGDFSTSINVIIPAGVHGGPRTRNVGPSSLLERWASGGHCDCGGWDLGCPLKVLQPRSCKGEDSPQEDMSDACKLFDLFIQGSGYGAPILRIANVHDGLYLIQYQSTLSTLQSFSIAVAYIHTLGPTLQPKNIQELT